jgi:hypothetical protein
MLSMAGYEELEGMGKIGLEAVATGMIEEGTNGPEIFLNWIWRICDSDNNLLFNGAGTQVLFRYSAIKRCGDAKGFCAVCEVHTRLSTTASTFQNVL